MNRDTELSRLRKEVNDFIRICNTLRSQNLISEAVYKEVTDNKIAFLNQHEQYDAKNKICS